VKDQEISPTGMYVRFINEEDRKNIATAIVNILKVKK